MDAKTILKGPHAKLGKQSGLGGADLIPLLDQVDCAGDFNGTLVDLGWDVESLKVQVRVVRKGRRISILSRPTGPVALLHAGTKGTQEASMHSSTITCMVLTAGLRRDRYPYTKVSMENLMKHAPCATISTSTQECPLRSYMRLM